MGSRLFVCGPDLQLGIANRLDLNANRTKTVPDLQAADHTVAAAIERLGEAQRFEAKLRAEKAEQARRSENS